MNTELEYRQRRTKIVATLGPATDDPDAMLALLKAGVNVARLNFSHGTQTEQAQRIQLVRQTAKKLGIIVGILADLQGPKIRVAKFIDGAIDLVKGAHFILSASHDPAAGTQERVGIDYKQLPQDVKVDDLLLLDDGKIRIKVLQVKGDDIHCEVIYPGKLSNHKGINRRGGGLNAKALTDKDKADLSFALGLNVDYIALSFPRDANDIKEMRQLILAEGGDAGIIAKIERCEAVDNIVEIIKAADGVMVARGDLAVEIGASEVPLVQQVIIKHARAFNKPVIVATQMLESMIMAPVPTRAEVSDVANAVLEHTDAVMLSAESSVGQYPVESVQMMADICRRVEQQPKTQISKHRVECEFVHVDEAIAMATMYTANHLQVDAVIALTETGSTTLWMSRIRTGLPIFGMCRCPRALGKMTLYRGVYPFDFDVTQFGYIEVNTAAIRAVYDCQWLSKDSRVILTKGDNLGVGSRTNVMKILDVTEVL